jgi:hypothetical protein
MKHIIKEILFLERAKHTINEVGINIDRSDYNWRKANKINPNPKKGETFIKKHVHNFETNKFKYVVEAEEYENDYFVISFYPKLPDNWYDKQSRLRMDNEDYDSKYSFKTSDEKFKIMGLIVSYMYEILNHNPLASFGYFGAPNKHTTDVDADMLGTDRSNLYPKILNSYFNGTHYPTFKIEKFSGGVLINKEKTKEIPKEEMLNYGQKILFDHL